MHFFVILLLKAFQAVRMIHFKYYTILVYPDPDAGNLHVNS